MPRDDRSTPDLSWTSRRPNTPGVPSPPTIRRPGTPPRDFWEATERPIGRNGRPRQACTMPGYNRGCKPRNAGQRYPAEPLTETEALQLLAVIPTHTNIGRRNLALFTLIWRTGLRISEALALRPHDIDPGARRVTVLCGKGGKRRTVGIDDFGLGPLPAWLEVRAKLDIEPRAPLFCTVQRPGQGNTVHSAYVRDILHTYGRRAGITKRVHPHGFRHSIACDLIRERFGLTDVQAQLGHTSPATTAIYLRGLGADEAFEKVATRTGPLTPDRAVTA